MSAARTAPTQGGGGAGVRIGVVLPSFAPTAGPAIGAAHAAEQAGLDGVFLYDHLWPMGHPGQPAIAPFPLLGALSVETASLALGTLVARVRLVPDEVLVGSMLTVHELSGGRFIAGVGTGDRKSAPENRAYGVGFTRARERRSALRAVVTRLLAAGVPTWVGGGSRATNALARERGAVLNLWGASPRTVAAASALGEVTWAGSVQRDHARAGEHLAEIVAAGATWAVYSWPGSPEPVLAAVEAAGVVLGGPGRRAGA